MIKRRRVGAITHVTLGGVIDETFTPEETLSDLRGYVVLDLGQVTRISSFGVRNWSSFVGQTPPGAQGLFLVNAPPVFVDQLNLVEGFAGSARLLSVLAPYRCEACDADRLCHIDVLAEAASLAEDTPLARGCAVCGGALEFTDTPAEFFDYVRRQHPTPIDASLQRFCQWLAAPGASELGSPIKIVEGEITYLALPSHLRGNLNVRRLSGGLEGRVVLDFAFVQKIDPEAVGKLRELLEVGAQSAELFLTRVPPQAIDALVSDPRPVPAKLLGLHLPQTCVVCGLQRAVETRPGALVGEGCPRCGGSAPTASLAMMELAASRFQLAPEDALQLEKISARALSQHLFGPATQEHGTGSIRIGESTASSGGLHRLQIIRRIGQGGMAEVFLARQVGENGFEKFLVMKKILSQFAESQEFVEMLFAEARANARLTHPNIVQTFDMGTMDGAAYITMEYVRGPDLKRLLKELGRKRHPLPVQHALRIVAEIAAGLHYAHSYVDPSGLAHPVVHRDVSPHNILVSLDGAIKLSDFGIAKIQGEERTEAGVIKGKVSYLSPEAACGRPLDARNDVFSLGVVLFELLTGRRPFKRDHDAATINAIVREPAPNPSELNPSIPQDVSDVVLRALVKDPTRRTPTAGVVHEELEAVMVRHGMTSTPYAVANFFKEVLADKLAEFAPPNSGSNPAIRRPTGVSRTDEPAAQAGRAPELGIRLPEGSAGPQKTGAPLVPTGSGLGGPQVPSASVGASPAGTAPNAPPAMEARRVPPIGGGSAAKVPLPGPSPTSAPVAGSISKVPPAGFISGVPTPGSISGVPPAASISDVPAAGSVSSVPAAGAISSVPPAGAISSVPPAGSISSVPPAGSISKVPAPGSISKVPAPGSISGVPAGAISSVPAGAISSVPPAGAISGVPAPGSISSVPPAGAISKVPAVGTTPNVLPASAPPALTPVPQIEAGEEEVDALLAELRERHATGELPLIQGVAAAQVVAPARGQIAPSTEVSLAPSPPVAALDDGESTAPSTGESPTGVKAEGNGVLSANKDAGRSPSEEPAGKKGRWVTWAVVLLALGGFGAGAAFVVERQSGVPVQGLAAGEQLYLNGERVQGDRVQTTAGSELFISTASDGKLSRFGMVQAGSVLDVRGAPQAQVAPGQTANLSIQTSGSGCTVSLSDGSVKNRGLPLQTPIAAASELEVILRCNGAEARSWIMAVPNQAVALTLEPG